MMAKSPAADGGVLLSPQNGLDTTNDDNHVTPKTANTAASYRSTVKSAISDFKRRNQEKKKARKREKQRKKRYMEPMSAVSSRSGLRNLKTRLSEHLKKGFPGNIPLPFFKELPQTWAHFQEMYGKCDLDLSKIERPPTFNGYGFMAPPEAQNESKRIGAVKRYLQKRKWHDKLFFQRLSIPFMNEYNMSGFSISLLDRKMQIVKHQSGLAMDVIARNVSIDGHALLSKDKLVLLDASNDWRMIYNPLVHGPPFIKFYMGVPLFSSDNQRIGVVAAFDPYARSSLPHNMDRYLMDISKKMTQFLDSLPSALSPRIESAEPTSPLDDDCDPDDDMCGRELGSFTQDGMPGLLPHNFDVKTGMNSLKRLNCNPELKQSYQIARELAQCISAKAAVERASRILADALGLSFVYVVEIRISSSYEVPAKYFPYSSGTPCKDIPQLDKILGPTIDRNVHIRLLGGHGLSEGEEPKFDQEIHAYALDSTYGIQYDAPDEKVSFRSGIFMPFQKSESKVIHTANNSRKVFQEVRNADAKTSKSEYKSFYTAGTDSFISTPDGLLEDVDPQTPTESHKRQSPGSFNEHIFKKFAKMSIQSQKKPPSGPTKLIKTRHGGYILAGFSLLHRSFSPGDIEYMKLCVKGLDTIFASN